MSAPTLHYNACLPSRKGVLVLNAVASLAQLPHIKVSLTGLFANRSFAKGQQAYPIGGLAAGKVLIKVGFFAVLLRFWKLSLFALGGAWAARKQFSGFGTKGN